MPNMKTNSVHGTNYAAAFTSILGGGPATTSPATGRTFSGNTVSVDRNGLDYRHLLSMGWAVLADHTGTTVQRPADLDIGGALLVGFRYYDTTLTAVVVKAANGWVNDATGAAA